MLVGVSRTSKTPLSIYLGYLGWKATNVPLVKGIDPPPELFEVDPGPGRRAHDRCAAARRDPQRADPADGRRPQLRRPERGLRGSRARGGDPPAARLPGDRRLGALDRGDRSAASSTIERVGRARDRRHGEAKTARSRSGAGRSGASCSDCARRLLRALHAVLVRTARRLLGWPSSVPAAAGSGTW